MTGKRLAIIAIPIFALWLSAAQIAIAHPGNTASDGCHYCRTNCASWGEVSGARHCHGGSAAPSPSYTPPPDPTRDFNGRTYSSYLDYLNAQDEYEQQQAEIRRLEEERLQLEAELEEQRLLHEEIEQEDTGEVLGEETGAQEVALPAQTSVSDDTDSGSDSLPGIFTTLAIVGTGGALLIRRILK